MDTKEQERMKTEEIFKILIYEFTDKDFETFKDDIIKNLVPKSKDKDKLFDFIRSAEEARQQAKIEHLK